MSKKKPQAPCRPSTLNIKGFAGIPVAVMQSQSYRALHLRSRAILFEIAARMNGWNNGQIVLSYEQIREATGCCNRDIGKSINELWQHGLIEFRECENWNQHIAREYKLTFVSSVSGNLIMPATNAYRDWTPPLNSRAKRKFHGDTVQPATPSAGDTVQPAWQSAGDKVQPAENAEPRKTPKNVTSPPYAAGDTVQPHIYNHGMAAAKPTPPRPPKGQGASDGDTHRDCNNHRSDIAADARSDAIAIHNIVFAPRCEKCGTVFNKTKASKRFCSETCRKAAEKARLNGRSKHDDPGARPIGDIVDDLMKRAVA